MNFIRDVIIRGVAPVLLTTATLVAAHAEGVPVGAGKDVYIKALSAMEPIMLQTQTAGGPGGVTAVYVEKYAAAIDEWSGGKIKLDIAYGSAIQRGENSPAIADGRLFFASVLPMYKPSEFPKNAAFAGMMYDPSHSPLVSVLQYNAAATDAATHTPELLEEYRDQGILLGLGGLPGLPMTLYCSKERDTLETMKGGVVRTSGKQHATQVESLGMSAVSMPWGEIFEALQRGVIDCALTHAMVYNLGGLDQVAPFASLPDKGSFAGGNSGVAFDLTAFDELPLAARQLLIDRLDVYFEGQVRAYMREAIKASQAITKANGKQTFFGKAAEAKLAEVTGELVKNARENGPFEDNGAVIDSITETQEKWGRILEELGYTEMDKGWDNVAEWLDPDTIDLKPFMERFYTEAILPMRPSE